MAWGVEGFVVSFIAPHSLTARALVVAPQRRAHGRQPLPRRADRRDGRRPPACGARAGRGRARRGSCHDQGTLAQIPGATFYHRLREKFGRLASWRSRAARARLCDDVVSRGRAGATDPPVRRAPLVHRRACCCELRVENLLLIERAELRLGPGLNVLTGETGAGKTVLAHALDLLLGRPGEARHRPARGGGGLRRGRLRAARRRCGDVLAERLPAGRRGARARPPRERRGPHARLPQRPRGDGGRPARPRRRAASPSTASTSTASSRSPRRSSRSSTTSAAPPSASGRAAFARALAATVRELERRAGRAARAGRRARARARPARVRARRDRGGRAARGRGGRAAGRARAPAPPRRRCAPPPPAAPRRWRPESGGAGGDVPARPAAAERRGARAGSTPSSTSSPSGCGRCASRPRTSAAELRRYGAGDRGGPGPARRGRGAPGRRSSGSSASTAARSPPCSRTPRRCRERRDELAGAEVALEAAEAGELAEARRQLDARGRGAARRPARRRRPVLAEGVRERLAELAMEGAAFEVALSPRPSAGPTGDDDGRVPDRAEPRGARGAAARDRVRRRALPGHARAHGRGGRRRRRARRRRRCSSSTRSTPASAATPRARSASGCGRCPTAARCSASPTCRRSPRWPTGTSAIAKDTAGVPGPRRPSRRSARPNWSGELVRMLGADDTDRAARRHAQLLKAA